MAKVVPVLSFMRFLVREISAKDFRGPAEQKANSGVMKLAPEIIFGCMESVKAPFHINVVVSVSATLERAAASSDKVAAEARIQGEAQFEVAEISLRQFKSIFNDTEFLDRLADQVYPLAITRLQAILAEMGFNANFPLSLPSVESRTKVLPPKAPKASKRLS